MENFYQLTDKILSFHINEVEYNGSIYKVIRDEIKNEFYTPAMGETIRKATLELLGDKAKSAIKKITYLKSLISELADFGFDAQTNYDAYCRFRELCAQGNFKMEIPCEFYAGGLDYSKLNPDDSNFHNDIKDELEKIDRWKHYQAKIIYSQNFIDDIQDAVGNRMAIINDLEKSLHRSIPGVELKRKHLSDGIPKRFERALNNRLMPDELTLTEWETVCKMEDIYLSEREYNLTLDFNNKSDGAELGIVASDHEKKSEAHTDALHYLEKELTEQGKPLLNFLAQEYKNCSSARMVSMLFALKEIGGIIEIKGYVKLAGALTVVLQKQGKSYNHTAISNGPPKRKNTVDDEVRKIKTERDRLAPE